jgi:hypothetical protein
MRSRFSTARSLDRFVIFAASQNETVLDMAQTEEMKSLLNDAKVTICFVCSVIECLFLMILPSTFFSLSRTFVPRLWNRSNKQLSRKQIQKFLLPKSFKRRTFRL